MNSSRVCSTIVERRRALAAGYGELLRGIPGVVPAVEPAWARTNWQSYTVRLEPPLDQRRVMQRMLDEGVSTRRGVMNAHREPRLSGRFMARRRTACLAVSRHRTR